MMCFLVELFFLIDFYMKRPLDKKYSVEKIFLHELEKICTYYLHKWSSFIRFRLLKHKRLLWGKGGGWMTNIYRKMSSNYATFTS